jgi:hypothetical protein
MRRRIAVLTGASSISGRSLALKRGKARMIEQQQQQSQLQD